MAACASCGHENPAGAKFCNGCGAALLEACSSCGTSNAPGARFCSECGAPLGAPAAAAAPAVVAADQPTERRLVSVLFADLVGFTTLSETRDAEEVRALLSRYFDTCRRLIELYGGTVEKFIGDAVMAVWGTPTATEDDAERAVRAALDLVAAVSALGQEAGAEDLRARAGVLTGEAAVNLAAAGEGMVAGDVVNTASRVQSVGRAGNRPGRRGDAARERAGDRLRGRGQLRAEGQGGHDAALEGAAGRLGRGRPAQVAGAGGAVRRPRSRAPADQGPVPRLRRREAGAARVRHGHRGDRQVTAGLGVLQVLRRDQAADLLAPWPLPGLRRGRHLLGAGRHGADALPDRRGRGARYGAREASRGARGAHPRRGGAAVPRASARAAARARRARDPRPPGPVRGLADLLRAPLGDVPDSARLRGHAVGRRVSPRLRRAPARVVAEPPAVRDHARPARAGRAAADVGSRASQLHLHVPRAARRGRRWRSSWPGWSPVCRPSCATRSSPGPKGCRCTRWRRCGCCSTAGSCSKRGRSTPSSARSSRWRCRRRCTR